MNLETTTCISYEHLDIIQRYAKLHKLSLSMFIINFINYVVSYKTINTKAYSRLSYRTRYSGNWKRLHIVLLEHEYEFIMDVRKVYKMSLAKVIAYCIDNYLYDFLNALEKEDNTDNYRVSGYSFLVFLEEGIQCCQFYWGPHPEILKIANATP
ncbi:MAG TPA: hypothetical protein PL059_00560 [Spirochaetota bacterium]|nr:hypothetical protein [Spirochaetota bacterium]